MSSKDDVVVGLVLAMALIAAPGSRLFLLRSRLMQLVTPTGSDEGITNMGPEIRMLRTADCGRKAASLQSKANMRLHGADENASQKQT